MPKRLVPPKRDSDPDPPPESDKAAIEPRGRAARRENWWLAVWEQMGTQIQGVMSTLAERPASDDRFEITISMEARQLHVEMGWKEKEDAADSEVAMARAAKREQALSLIDAEQRADEESPTAGAILNELLSVEPEGDTLSRRLESAVEDALKNYHKLAKLETNPLAGLLSDEDGEQAPYGTAKKLRQALDEAIDGLSVSETPSAPSDPANPADYLDLRYRQGLLHKDIAARWGYTERHLLRLRREMIEAVTLFFKRFEKKE